MTIENADQVGKENSGQAGDDGKGIMGRVLGRVEYADGEPDRFFIHDDTTGWSISPLFADPDEAWRIYDQGDVEGLVAAMPQRDTVVRVIRKFLSRSRSFPPGGELYGERMFGLATTDRVLHVAEDVDGGSAGRYDKPLCADRWKWSDRDRRVAFDEVFGQPIKLCPHCVDTLLKTVRDE